MVINEGSIWEAAMLAAGQNVDNPAIIDYNKWQATGKPEVMAIEPSQKGSLRMACQQMTDMISKRLAKLGAARLETKKGSGDIKKSFVYGGRQYWHYRIPNEIECSTHGTE